MCSSFRRKDEGCTVRGSSRRRLDGEDGRSGGRDSTDCGSGLLREGYMTVMNGLGRLGDGDDGRMAGWRGLGRECLLADWTLWKAQDGEMKRIENGDEKRSLALCLTPCRVVAGW